MNFFYANGTPIINSLKVTSEVPLDPRLTVENIAERDSLVTNHISYDRMKVYVKSNDTKYIYHKDTGEWEIDNKFSEEDKSKLDKIDNYLIDTEHIYNPENKLFYREHSYDPNTDITTLRDHILQEARVSENGELYNGLLSKFYVNRLNNITNYLTDVSFTKGTDMPNLYLTTHSYNPDEDKTTLTNIDIPLATDDNHGLLSNLQNIKVNRIVDYVNRIDTTHTNAPDTGLTYNYNIYNPFTNANVTKTILIPLVTHTENGLTSSSDKIKIDDIETYVKSIALRQASETEELGIDYIITNPNDQTDTPGYFNIPLVTDTRNGLVSPARKHWMDNANGVSNTGTASDTWQLDKKDINTRLDPNGGVIIKDSGGIAEIRNNTDSAYSDLTLNNITIKGNVTQEGKSFITEAETVEVRDNTLLLNRGETGAGVSREFAGIEIDRGSEPKYQILFDESDDRFKVGKEGDLWCVTLRDDEADMEDGMFTTWDASTKRLKTTNIVPANRNITFANGKDDGWSYSLKINENSGYLSIETFWHTLELDLLRSDFATFDLTKVTSNHRKFKFLKPIISDTIECTDSNYIEFYSPNHMGRDRELVLQLGYSKTRFAVSVYGTTFYRTSDNSEVLYHADIVNNLTSGGVNKVLSAEQGKLLNNAIEDIRGTYLPLTGGTMSGSIRFPVGLGIVCEDVSGSAAYGVLRTWNYNGSTRMYVGTVNFPTYISSTASDLIHDRNGSSYLLWDAYNLPTPASTTDLTNYLPLAGGTLTGQVTIQQSIDIKLRLQSTDADNYCIIQAINAQASQLGVFGYAGDKWAIGHGGTYYEIWDKYNLTDPVTYTTNEYNHATLKNKNGQYFTYIKAGTNGLLPHSKATLTSGGSGSLGTSDQGFNAAYINNLHTNKVTFGDAGSFIDNQSGDSSHIGIGFYTSRSAGCPVYVGSLCVSDGYANSAPNIPANGIYSKGIIYIENGIGFRNSIWTNDLTPNRNYSGYLQVLDAYDAANAGGPTNYGTVLQINSRNSHWANQLWFPGGIEASKNGLYCRHMAYNQTEYGDWQKILTNKDVNIIPTQSTSNPTTLPVNQIFYSEIQRVDGTPTVQGALFSVQGDDEGIQLWADSTRTELYYRTKWTSYGNWIKLATTSNLGNYLPLSGGTISSSKSNPLTINSTHVSQSSIDFSRGGVNKGTVGFYESLGSFLQNVTGETLAVKSDGAYYGVNTNSLRKLATVTDLGNYLPLTGGALSGTLTINTVGDHTLIINNNDTNGIETFVRVLRKGTPQAAIGFYDGLGAYIYNYNSAKYLFIDNDGYARVGTTSGSTRLALITDIPSVSGYLPLSGGTMSGNISFNGDTGHIVVGARETSNFVSAVSFNKGSATNSAYIGYHSTGGSDSSGALILVPYPTTANPWAKTVGLYIAKNELLLDGKQIATQEYVNNRSVSWSNITGKPSTYTPSAHSHNSLQIEDNRDVTMLPNNMGPTTLRTFFNANKMPTSDWYSGIHISGWVTNYAAWQLCGPSSNNTTTASSLYFRSGKDSTWNSWKKIAFTSDIPTSTSHLTNDSGFITSSALSGYATQSWANGQFAPLKNYFVTGNYASIATTGNEMCIGSLTSGNSIINVNYRNGTGTTSPSTWYWRAGSSTTWANAYWGNLYMNNNLVATQIWASGQFPTKTGTGASGTWGISISGNAATATTATKWNGYSIWTGTEDELPSSRDANTLYFVKKSS